MELAGVSAAAASAAALLLGPFPPRAVSLGHRHHARLLVVVVVVLSGTLLGLATGAGPLLLGWVAAAGAALIGSLILLRRARRAELTRLGAVQVLAACEGLVADLESGSPAVRALVDAAEVCPALARVARAATLGSDVVAALRLAAAAPGCDHLRLVAAAWAVSQRVGDGLATSLRATALMLRADAVTRRVVNAELSSARATARLMAMLPVFTWLLALGTGADPLGFLLGTGFGLGCLVVGLVLAMLGVGWIDQLARRVEREL